MDPEDSKSNLTRNQIQFSPWDKASILYKYNHRRAPPGKLMLDASWGKFQDWTDFNDKGILRCKPKRKILRARILLHLVHKRSILPHEVGVLESDDLHLRMEKNSKSKLNSARSEIPSSQPVL